MALELMNDVILVRIVDSNMNEVCYVRRPY